MRLLAGLLLVAGACAKSKPDKKFPDAPGVDSALADAMTDGPPMDGKLDGPPIDAPFDAMPPDALTIPDAMTNPDGMESPDAPIDGMPPDGGTPIIVGANLAAGLQHTCARNPQTGAVRCWGDGGYGRLGYGNISDIGDDSNEFPSSAGDVPLGNVFVDSISAGNSHTCVIHSGGEIRCWGYNASGRLGLSSTTNIGDNETATQNVDFGTGVALDVAAGGEHTCMLSSDNNRVRCWGQAYNGQLGYGNQTDIGDNEHPSAAGDVNTGAVFTVDKLEVGDDHSCVLFTNGNIRCWGENSYGQLGLDSTTDVGTSGTPANQNFVQLGGFAQDISLGYAHTCALMTNGDVRCWGRNSNGQLGLGSTSHLGDNEHPDSQSPVQLPTSAIAVKAGWYHTCALLSNGDLTCWGFNNYGQLGLGNTDTIGDNESPTMYTVDLNGQRVVDFTVGGYHTCAQVETGGVYCWGRAAQGQLGYGNTDSIGDNEPPWHAGTVSVW